MRLELIPPSDRAFFQEPVRLALRLTMDDESREIPYEHDSYDCLSFRLFDAARQPIGQADGYTRDLRLGLQPVRVDLERLPTETAPANASLEWTEDLLAYFDLPPGQYWVQARVFYPRAGEALSEAVPLGIEPCACRAFDAIADAAAMTVIHVVQQYEAGVPALFQFRSVQEPGQSWHGAILAGTPLAAARVAETDFLTRESYAHDFRRWIAWLDDGRVTLTLVENDSAAPLRTQPVSIEDARLIGRPVQHADGGVSALLMDGRAGGWRLHRLDFDAEGGIASRIAATAEDGSPAPIVTAVDHYGSIFLLSGTAGKLPAKLWRISGAELTSGDLQIRVAGAGEPQLLCARLDVKPRAKEWKPRALLAGLVQRDAGRFIWLAEFVFDAGSLHAGQPRIIEFPFHDEEEIAGADLLNARNGRLHAFVVTASGSLVHMEEGRGARPIAPPGSAIAGPVHILDAAGPLVAFYASRNFGARFIWLEPAR